MTEEPFPGDFDACWDPTAVEANKLDPVLLDLSDGRRQQRLKYGGELFPSSPQPDGTIPFVRFFTIDRDTGRDKGIVRLRTRDGKKGVGP